MSKPEGYPFLRIAKQYGADYSAVLKVADDLKTTGCADWLGFPDGMDPLVMLDIAVATRVQQAIRDGEIDWQTGEPIDYDAYDGPDKLDSLTPGTLAYAMRVDADMTDPAPKAGETPEQARARRDYYRGHDDDGLPSD